MSDRSSRTLMHPVGPRSGLPLWHGRRLLLFLACLALARAASAGPVPFPATVQAPAFGVPAPWMDALGSSPARSYAYPNWVAPSHLEVSSGSPGLHAATSLPGLPGRAALSAAVVDRYDWLPTLGVNAYHDRPWLQVGTEWDLRRARTRPFLGIGASLPLVSAEAGMPADAPPATQAAARGQIGLYAGVRF